MKVDGLDGRVLFDVNTVKKTHASDSDDNEAPRLSQVHASLSLRELATKQA